jgi:hypothetical protein
MSGVMSFRRKRRFSGSFDTGRKPWKFFKDPAFVEKHCKMSLGG